MFNYQRLKYAFFLFSISLNLLADIPGYIGRQSFRLTDDRELSHLIQAVDNAKVEFTRLDSSRSDMRSQIDRLVTELTKLRSEMDELNNQLAQDKVALEELERKLIELQKNPEANKVEIDTTIASIERFNTLIKNKSTALGQLKLQSAPLNVKLDQLNNDYKILDIKANEAQARLFKLRDEKDRYERYLVSEILKINREGSIRGTDDGRVDGNRMAYDLGNRNGQNDGLNDGHTDGTNRGKERDYQRGAAQGDRDGSAKALIDGERDGIRLGTIDGNIKAATLNGARDGKVRAERSDAAVQGTKDGAVAGLKRAQVEGKREGDILGEDEAVKKSESTPLENVIINGNFAGSFSRRSPSYPGDFNGDSYRPDISVNKEVLKRAYADGYIHLYRYETRNTYNLNIDGFYNRAYSESYDRAYNESYNRDYPEDYNAGRVEGERLAYNRNYPIIKKKFYQEYFLKFEANPNTSSEEYKTTYKKVEDETYRLVYGQIFRAAFELEEMRIFKLNIERETQESKNKRVAAVLKIYKENAVLKFVSSELVDSGINKVGSDDGVFQPNETITGHLIVSNFGFAPANNVSVKLSNGEVVKIPSINARSTVKVLGAFQLKNASDASLGKNHLVKFAVLSSANTTDPVERIHFDNIADGILRSGESHTIKVQFPFNLISLKLSSLLLKDQKNKLVLSLINNSKRAYLGDMKVEVLVNSNNQLLVKPFDELKSANVGENISLDTALVLVQSEDDIYRDLSFSAKLTQNGVEVGRLGSDLLMMAKASYISKTGVPVVTVNSDSNLVEFKNVLADLGGTSKVSILDLSILNVNQEILNSGLNNRSVIVLDKTDGASLKSLNGFISKSNGSSFLLVNNDGNLFDVFKTLPISADHQKLPFEKREVRFTNPYRVQNIRSNAFILSSPKGIVPSLGVLDLLSKNAKDHANEIKATINSTNFFTPSDLIKSFNLKAMAEVLNINVMYDKSGRIFNRDKKWIRLVGEDKGLYLNELKAISEGRVETSKLGAVLSAISLKDFLSTAMRDYDDVRKLMMGKIQSATNDLLNDLEDSFKKSLKEYNKDLYNKSYDKALIHRPFYIEPPAQDNF